MKVAMVGEGAIARSHLDVLAGFPGVDISLLVGGNLEATESLAEELGIPSHSLDIETALVDPEIDAVILCSPTPLHAEQSAAALAAGKNCLIEIPMASDLASCRKLAALAEEAGPVAMVAHTRRFNRGHRWVHERLVSQELHLQHLVVETYFFRRTNMNIHGVPRTWTDSLLWHHACHTVDLFQYQTSSVPERAFAIAGPTSETLGIPMDLSIGMSAPSGALLSVALSFNNEGVNGTTFRYICDEGTFLARYDDLTDGAGRPVDFHEAGPLTGIEAQDREFFDAILEGREPNASVRQCLPAMETLDRLERQLL
jgi:2-hydroxy-4-carboxymuconate semialdehyde hemiacetal dehydrogenase